VNGDRLLMYIFLLTVAGYGVFGVVAPSRLLQPKADWWLFDWLTGRVFYTSITRVRVTLRTIVGNGGRVTESGSTSARRNALMSTVPAHNKRMQRARDPDKFVLGYAHRRVADLRRYVTN
jgi:hypothetical protein